MITDYLPGMGDKTSGSVDLTLAVVPVSACVPSVASVKHVTLDPCTGMQETSSNELTLAIQPNPAHGTVTITLDGLKEKTANLTINSIDGKSLFSATINAMTKKVVKTIDLTGFARGIYSVQVITNGQIQTKQLVVQ